MQIREFIGDRLIHLEECGDLVPGAAVEIMKSFRTSGDIFEDTETLFSGIYGRPAIESQQLRGETIPGTPAIPPSPFLAPDAPSRKLAPVAAALARLGITWSEDAHDLSARFVNLTPFDAPTIASRIVQELYGNRENHYTLRKTPPLPAAERRAFEAIQRVKHLFSPRANLEQQATDWADVGKLPIAQAVRVVVERLRDPRYTQTLAHRGIAPEMPHHTDECFDPTPAESQARAELHRSGGYDGSDGTLSPSQLRGAAKADVSQDLETLERMGMSTAGYGAV